MARAYGSSAHLLMKRETVYGQAATGDYIRMPFNRCNLGSEQGLIDDPVLGQGRDPLAPLQDVINDEGDIVKVRFISSRASSRSACSSSTRTMPSSAVVTGMSHVARSRIICVRAAPNSTATAPCWGRSSAT